MERKINAFPVKFYEDFLTGPEIETAMYKSLAPVLEKHRTLICPTLRLPATKAGESYVKKT